MKRQDVKQSFLKELVDLHDGECEICESTFNLMTHHWRYPKEGEEDVIGNTILTCLLCHSRYHEVFPLEAGPVNGWYNRLECIQFMTNLKVVMLPHRRPAALHAVLQCPLQPSAYVPEVARRHLAGEDALEIAKAMNLEPLLVSRIVSGKKFRQLSKLPRNKELGRLIRKQLADEG